MKSGRGMVEIFGKCSRLLNKIALNIEDGFFSQLCAKESDKLLSEFIFFLRGEEGVKSDAGRREHRVAQDYILQHKNVAKYPQIVRHKIYVAQSGRQLIFRIKNILNLLDILKHLRLAKPPTSLLLEKNLLLLKLSVLNTTGQAAVLSGKVGKPASPKPRRPSRSKSSSPVLIPAHREISEFVRSKERVQNLEVFRQFAQISRRTMKRKLSELIKAGVIKRFTDGKKVFYSPLKT